MTVLKRENDLIQEVETVNGVKVVIIKCDDKLYIPISYLEQKVLLRNKGSFKTKVDSDKTKMVKVDFGLITGRSNIQNSLCVEIEELKRVLINHTQPSRLTVEQRKKQNELHQYLGIEELPLVEFDVQKFDKSNLDNYLDYIRPVVVDVLNSYPEIPGRICTNCLTEYPLHENFFYKEISSSGSYSRTCIECKQGKECKFTRDDEYEKMLRRKNLDEQVIVAYRENPIATIYNLYINGTIGKFPVKLRTKENLKIIINKLFKDGKLNNVDGGVLPSSDELLKHFKINLYLFEKTTMREIYSWVFGENFYLEKWKYPKIAIKTSKDEAVDIFNNYIKSHKIEISDPLSFNYNEIFHKCYMRAEDIFGGLISFLVYYWKGKYAGYQFKNSGNYYRLSDENVLYDLKFLIESDLKLQVEKIPLYITKQSLKSYAKSLYNYIVTNKNGSLYEWFNKIYPNKFIETDFTIGKYRNNFDSVQEEQIDEILRENFKSVIYNYNNSDQVVELKGKKPDWFIMREDGVWLVEYFGLYIESQKSNPIVKSYIETTHEKIRLYNEMSGYNFLLVYPTDLDNNFFGLRVKIKEIIDRDNKIGVLKAI